MYAHTCETTTTNKLVNMSLSIKVPRCPFTIPPSHSSLPHPNPKHPFPVTMDELALSGHFCK